MAYNSEVHDVDPVTGFLVDKDTGHRINLEARPHVSTVIDREYPKYVEVHDSHINRQETEGAPAHVSAKGWPHFHVDRGSGAVSVLVMNEDEEQRATSDYEEPKAAEASRIDPRIRLEVAREYDKMLLQKSAATAAQEQAERDRLIDQEAERRTKEYQERLSRNREEADRSTSESIRSIDDAMPGPGAEERRKALADASRPVVAAGAGQKPMGAHPYNDGLVDNHQNKIVEGSASTIEDTKHDAALVPKPGEAKEPAGEAQPQHDVGSKFTQQESD